MPVPIVLMTDLIFVSIVDCASPRGGKVTHGTGALF